MGVTNNLNFTTLNGSDPAGHGSINAVIQSIDDSLSTISTGLVAGAGASPTATTGQVLRWSGTSFANAFVDATSLAANAVTESKIDTGAVTNSKLGTGAVTSAKIADGTITETDLAFSVATQTELDNHASDTTSVHGITDTSALALKSGNTYTGTHDYTGATIIVPTATAGDNDTSAASTAFVSTAVSNAFAGTGVIGTNAIQQDAVTYDKLNDDAKVYAPISISSTPTTLTIGTHDSTKNTTIPLVKVDNSSSNYVINIPTGGVVGSTINIFQTGTGTVTIQPVSSSVTINGSTSNTYILGSAYSIVTLICYASNTWIITGDYI